jgi:hypothetical protein
LAQLWTNTFSICKLVIVLTLIWTNAAWGACDITTFFSPSDNIEAVIGRELIKAKKSVHCSLFGISNPNLAQNLIKQERWPGRTLRWQ